MTKTPVAEPWIKYWQRKPQASLRLFCFPYAGGSASIYRNWSSQMPPEIEVWPVQLPGRENRILETPFSRITPLIESLSAALRPYLDMPYAFFGHSMGALLSYELLRHLQQQQVASPLYLFISGRPAPQLPDTEPPIHQLPDHEFLVELRKLQGTPEEVLQNTELLQLLLPTLRADFALCETYTYIPGAPLSCPITAFGGLQDDEAPRAKIEPWREQTSNIFKARFFPGNHFFLHTVQSSLLLSLCQDLLRCIPPAHLSRRPAGLS